jgi:hypothetical protein
MLLPHEIDSPPSATSFPRSLGASNRLYSLEDCSSVDNGDYIEPIKVGIAEIICFSVHIKHFLWKASTGLSSFDLLN